MKNHIATFLFVMMNIVRDKYFTDKSRRGMLIIGREDGFKSQLSYKMRKAQSDDCAFPGGE